MNFYKCPSPESKTPEPPPADRAAPTPPASLASITRDARAALETLSMLLPNTGSLMARASQDAIKALVLHLESLKLPAS
ncbi:MAG: hypothetical protein LBR80_17015 [Deltaproteobacteria bacterium]|nr:hypothetical protein [Deltaproteobacteria bacterium]